jgi:hypothetical protein
LQTPLSEWWGYWEWRLLASYFGKQSEPEEPEQRISNSQPFDPENTTKNYDHEADQFWRALVDQFW